MCGIAGFAGENHETIARMTDAIRHRGPDGQVTLVTHGVSLGHARLAILDPSPRGNQPMWNENHTVVIVYNGEIFNFKELRERHHLPCHTGTDTEVLLRLYDKEGTGFLPKLRGMYAFALYDTRTQTFVLARDPSGIKPLFVSFPNGKLHFASEMRALLHALPVKPPLNFQALSQYLRLQYVPGPETLCAGIESLPPGTILTWSQEHGERREAFQSEAPPYAFRSKEEFSSAFPDIFDEAVREHLVSDRPVGIFLSGGMDSSIVLHHMAHHAAKPIRTFTVRFEASEAEGAERFNRDAELARKTSMHYGTEHTEVFLTATLCRELYRETARALDQPNADSVATAQVLLAREAKKVVDVTLTGAGGDELFGGYPRYRITRILHGLRCIPRMFRCTGARVLGYPSDVLGMSPGPGLYERLLARPEAELQRVTRGDWFDPKATTRLFEERFQETSRRPAPTLRDGPSGLFSVTSSEDPLRSFMEFDRKTWLVDESLRLMDATTMAHGLEGRIPFLDPRVIAASHGTKTAWHVGYLRTKALLKDTYFGGKGKKPLLPLHLKELGKACFYPPLAKWFRREARVLVEEMLEHPRIKELFSTETLRTIFERHLRKEAYELHTLSSLTQLAFWFDTVYDTK